MSGVRSSAKVRTAFVFAGGGSLGAIQVGALRALVRAGARPDFVVGASVGALNACFYASAPTPEGVAALEAVWRSLRRRDIFPVTMRGAMGAFRSGGGLFEATSLRALIGRSLALERLEHMALPVCVVATNLHGASVVFSEGPAAEALLASAAIPIAFPPVRIGDQFLIDAAIAGNTPVIVAAEMGAERIIVLQTGYACALDRPPSGPVAPGFHALTLLIANQLARDVQLLDGKASIHVTPHLCPLDVSPFNFDQSGPLIERSAAATRAWIEAGGLERDTKAAALAHPH
ncbi:MAG: patatin-like phospholipase family protein [Alphaproteobacteria bacterium]|nr:patatin-like phospholipase family protein [Alphaproteobacteria bacterium]